MEIGYRVIRPEDVGTQPLMLAQISLWRLANWGVADGEKAVEEAIEMARNCRQRGIRSVFHPLEYPLVGEHGEETLSVLRRLASEADLGIIIHDEGGEGGRRLSNAEAEQYEKNVDAISALCHISVENSFNSGDITWFWERFVVPAPERVSMTLDIGHLELAGLDSAAFVRNMLQHFLRRIRFIHMHHHDAQEPHTVKDHLPLVPGCREIEALKELLHRKQDVDVILELDSAKEGMKRSIELLATI